MILFYVLGECEKDWDQYLDPILLGIRTSVQASTEHTPFLLMHGREARLPLEVEKAQPIADTKQLPEIDRRIDQLTKLKDKIFPAVMANIDMAQTKLKEQYCQRKGLGKQEIKAWYHATSCVVVPERQLRSPKCLSFDFVVFS